MARFLALVDTKDLYNLRVSGEIFANIKELTEIYTPLPYDYMFNELLEKNYAFSSVLDKVFLIVTLIEERIPQKGLFINVAEIDYVISITEAAKIQHQKMFPEIIFEVAPEFIINKHIEFLARHNSSLGSVACMIMLELLPIPMMFNLDNLKKQMPKLPQELITGIMLRCKGFTHYQTSLQQRTLTALITTYKRHQDYPNNDFGYVYDLLEIYYYTINREIKKPLDYKNLPSLIKPYFNKLDDLYKENPNLPLLDIITEIKKFSILAPFVNVVSNLSKKSFLVPIFCIKSMSLAHKNSFEFNNIVQLCHYLPTVTEKEDFAIRIGACLGYNVLSPMLYKLSALPIYTDISNTIDAKNHEESIKEAKSKQRNVGYNYEAYSKPTHKMHSIHSTKGFISNLLSVLPEDNIYNSNNTSSSYSSNTNSFATTNIDNNTQVTDNTKSSETSVSPNSLGLNSPQCGIPVAQDSKEANDLDFYDFTLSDPEVNDLGFTPVFNDGAISFDINLLNTHESSSNEMAQFLSIKDHLNINSSNIDNNYLNTLYTQDTKKNYSNSNAIQKNNSLHQAINQALNIQDSSNNNIEDITSIHMHLSDESLDYNNIDYACNDNNNDNNSINNSNIEDITSATTLNENSPKNSNNSTSNSPKLVPAAIPHPLPHSLKIAYSQQKTAIYNLGSLKGINEALQIVQNFQKISELEIESAINNIILAEAPIKKDMIVARFKLLAKNTNTKFYAKDHRLILAMIDIIIGKQNLYVDDEDFIFVPERPVFARNRDVEMSKSTSLVIKDARNISISEIYVAIILMQNIGNAINTLPLPIEVMEVLGINVDDTTTNKFSESEKRINNIIKEYFMDLIE